MSLHDWACAQVARMLPIDEESINQVVTYTISLSTEDAAAHLKNLLGDSPQALEFISSFNARRVSQRNAAVESKSDSTRDAVPKHRPKKKKNTGLNHLPEVRRPDNYGDTSGGYRKKEDGDYMPAAMRPKSRDGSLAPAFKETARSSSPSLGTSHRAEAFSNLLDPSLPNVHTRTASPGRKTNASTPSPSMTPRTASPSKAQASTKVSISGGTPMHGASSTLADLDSAIRALEMSTNPTIPPPSAALRRCNCMGSLHPILASAPNCLSCGKIVCLKEGLAPCTFCGAAILSTDQVQEMVRALREERGRERMAVHNASQQRPEVSTTPRPFSSSTAGRDTALEQAQAHRDRLLGFQAANAARTRVIDEAAAFETPDMGVSQWGSAVERAAQLKRQQRALREMEWNARPEYEKRKTVVSVDIVNGKVIKKISNVRREDAKPPSSEDEEVGSDEPTGQEPRDQKGGAFSRNPLLGGLIRPVWQAETADNGPGSHVEAKAQAPRQWRRVQDDVNNEEVILDGGVFGGDTDT